MSTSPSWTMDQLVALEAAIAQGALRVEYRDKKVEYRSIAEMMQIRDLMRKALGLVSGKMIRVRPKFSKGLKPGSLSINSGSDQCFDVNESNEDCG